MADDDPEMRLALELSMKSYTDEENRRCKESSPSDLISFESPEEREQNRKISIIQNIIQRSNSIPSSPRPLNPPLQVTPGYQKNHVPILSLDPGPPPPLFPRLKIPPHTSSPQRPDRIPSSTSSGLTECPSPRTPNPWRPQQYSPGYQSIEFFKKRESENTSTSALDHLQPAVIHELYVPYTMLNAPGKIDGDLIDLATPHSEVAKATIDQIRRDFDPLYKPSSTIHAMPQPVARLERTKGLRTENHDVQACRPAAIKEIDRLGPKRSESLDLRSQSPTRIYSLDDIKLVEQNSDVTHQVDKLRQRGRIHARQTSDFFNSPTADYMTTNADSVKIEVYKDHTWRSDFGEHKMTAVFDTHATIDMILMEVLMRFCEESELPEGRLPIEDYGLKVFGLDEFLPGIVHLGKFLYVGSCLLFGKDVKLEVGRRIPVVTGSDLDASDYENVKTRIGVVSTLDKEDINNVLIQLRIEMEKYEIDALENNQLSVAATSNKVRQCVKMLCKIMQSIQPKLLYTSLQQYLAAGTKAILEMARQELIINIHKLIATYCRSTRSEYTVIDLEPSTKEIKNIYDVVVPLQILINSLHGIPDAWLREYQQFYVTIHAYYGTQCVDGHEKVIPKEVDYGSLFPHVPFDICAKFATDIRRCARETKYMIILSGMRKVDSSDQDAQLKPEEHLAVASISLFDHNSMMRQGDLFVPLSPISGPALQPWGPHPLITSQKDPILYITLAHYDYDVMFPDVTMMGQITATDPRTLGNDKHEYLMDLVETIEPQNLIHDDREALWQQRAYLMHIPEALPLVLASVPIWDYGYLSNIYPLLDAWAPLSPLQALVLLLPQYPDVRVRTKALDWIRKASNDFLFNFLPQLVEALRFETYEHSSLATLLLILSNKDRRFAFEIYWQLQQRIDHCPYNDLSASTYAFVQRCQMMQRELLHRHEGDSLRKEICAQHRLLNSLEGIDREVKTEFDTMQRILLLRTKLGPLDAEVLNKNCRLPMLPSFLCTGVNAHECTVFNSNAKPLKISFKGLNMNYSIILKTGDDMRQDALVLHMVRLMNDVWMSKKLDLRMITYKCMPFGFRKGMSELVQNCSTLCEIQNEQGQGVSGVFKDDVLCKWLEKHNSTEYLYRVALDNFRRSCAGWCVVTYVLGIGDRHNDNIMVTQSGHVFHIDFGKYMGDWQTAGGFKRDRVPFVFTKEMFTVINGGKQHSGESYQMFIDNCCKAFNYLRKSHSIITNLIKIMACSDIPGVSVESLHFVEKNLMLDLTDTDAIIQFTQLINCSLNSAFPRLNFLFHALAQKFSKSSSSVSPAEDNRRLSFVPHTYTQETDGKIRRVDAVGFEKHNMPNKVYLYRLVVDRENEAVKTNVYRSFAEVHELYLKLKYRFPTVYLPTLTRSSGGITEGLRSNIREVANRRLCDIKIFLQSLFILEAEICHCDLVYTFFHIMLRDSSLENGGDDGARIVNQELPQIYLKLTYHSPKKTLSIFVAHVKHLPMLSTGQKPDAYVKTYLKPDSNNTTKRKTSVVKSSQAPTFNSELSYDLRAMPDVATYLENHGLEVSVWNSGGLKDNVRMCTVFIPLFQLWNRPPDRKGSKAHESWYSLAKS